MNLFHTTILTVEATLDFETWWDLNGYVPLKGEDARALAKAAYAEGMKEVDCPKHKASDGFQRAKRMVADMLTNRVDVLAATQQDGVAQQITTLEDIRDTVRNHLLWDTKWDGPVSKDHPEGN